MTHDEAMDQLAILSNDWTRLTDGEREALNVILGEDGRYETDFARGSKRLAKAISDPPPTTEAREAALRYAIQEAEAKR